MAEAPFAERLASNEPRIRQRAMKSLRRWMAAKIQHRSQTLNEKELLKLWRGLYACMWMSDKPLVQVSHVVCAVTCRVHCVLHRARRKNWPMKLLR